MRLPMATIPPIRPALQGTQAPSQDASAASTTNPDAVSPASSTPAASEDFP